MGELGLLILEKAYGRFDTGRAASLDKLQFTQVLTTSTALHVHDTFLESPLQGKERDSTKESPSLCRVPKHSTNACGDSTRSF